MKKIIISLIFCFCTQIWAKNHITHVQLSRSYNKLVSKDNQLIITTNDKGDTEVIYPKAHHHYGKKVSFANVNESSSAMILARQIDQSWKAVHFQRRMSVIKSRKKSNMFYSSDKDLWHLQLKNKDDIIWEIKLDNLHELEHFSDELGHLKTVIELLLSLDEMSINPPVQTTKEHNS